MILPKASRDEDIDLRTHYYREARPFFSFGLRLVVGFAKDWLLDRGLPPTTNLVFLVFFVAATVVALLIRRPRVHEVIAPLMATVIILFFATIFARL